LRLGVTVGQSDGAAQKNWWWEEILVKYEQLNKMRKNNALDERESESQGRVQAW